MEKEPLQSTTVLVPPSLKEWARVNGVNMSFVLRQRLIEMRDEYELKELERKRIRVQLKEEIEKR